MHAARSFAILLWMAAPAIAADTFSLEVPGQPGAQSTAVLSADEIIITDSTGARFVYQLQPALNSPDGQFLGYHSAAAGAWMRWPISNRGAMQIGQLRRGVITWTPSRMQIISRPVTALRPPLVTPPGGVSGTVGDPASDPFAAAAGLGSGFRITPPRLSILDRQGQWTLAHIGGQGNLRFFTGRDQQWRGDVYQPSAVLIPGTSLVLLGDAVATLPRAYTIDPRGQLVEIVAGSRVNEIRWHTGIAPTFARDTNLARISDQLELVAIDQRGRCLLINPAGSYTDVGPYNYRAVPGAPIQAVRDADGQINLFTIDQSGRLFRLRPDANGQWQESLIESGHVPGGNLTVAAIAGPGGAGNLIHVAAVDQNNSVRVHREPFHQAISIDSANVFAGSPLLVTTGVGGELSVTAITADGLWNQWVYRSGWQQRVIRGGFEPGSHLVCGGRAPLHFAIDPAGDLIAAYWTADRWETFVCGLGGSGPISGGFVPPRLISREVIPNPPLPAVDVQLLNTHQEDLLVRINALGNPNLSTQLEIPAGGSAVQRFDRDAGSTIVETVEIVAPDGSLVTEVFRQAVPPQPLYALVVYENRIQSVVIDRTARRLAADQIEGVTKGLRSVGVFALPAGAGLTPRQVIDVFRNAERAGNPGAAATLP